MDFYRYCRYWICYIRGMGCGASDSGTCMCAVEGGGGLERKKMVEYLKVE